MSPWACTEEFAGSCQPGVEILGHNVYTSWTLLSTVKSFSKVVAPIHSPTNKPYIQLKFLEVLHWGLLLLANLLSVKWFSILVWICISLLVRLNRFSWPWAAALLWKVSLSFFFPIVGCTDCQHCASLSAIWSWMGTEDQCWDGSVMSATGVWAAPGPC